MKISAKKLSPPMRGWRVPGRHTAEVTPPPGDTLASTPSPLRPFWSRQRRPNREGCGSQRGSSGGPHRRCRPGRSVFRSDNVQSGCQFGLLTAKRNCRAIQSLACRISVIHTVTRFIALCHSDWPARCLMLAPSIAMEPQLPVTLPASRHRRHRRISQSPAGRPPASASLPGTAATEARGRPCPPLHRASPTPPSVLFAALLSSLSACVRTCAPAAPPPSRPPPCWAGRAAPARGRRPPLPPPPAAWSSAPPLPRRR